jgi:hypothetical protein
MRTHPLVNVNGNEKIMLAELPEPRVVFTVFGGRLPNSIRRRTRRCALAFYIVKSGQW